MPDNNNIELRSEEVQEIISQPPRWIVRSGITVVFLILSFFMFLSWLIEYPDKISGKVILTTNNPPLKLIVKASGEIGQIYVKDNSSVVKDQKIATIQSTLSNASREFLITEIRKIRDFHTKSSLEKYTIVKSNFVFGEMQSNYSALITAIKNYQALINDNAQAFNIQNTTKQISNQKDLYNLTIKQTANVKKLVDNANDKFNSDKILLEKGIISQSDFYERERIHKSTISDLQNLEKVKIQSSITITDLEKQLYQLKLDYNQQRRTLLNDVESNLSAIENALFSWKKSYQFFSPIAGKLTYLQPLSKNKFIEQGKELFAIIPNDQEYIAEIKISKEGFGKVKSGQKVMLKIDKYPFHEFGQLEGKVYSVALLSSEDTYLVKVKLTNGLTSTYGKKFRFTPELSGTAEIITEDLRISDRIFNSFRKLFI